MPVCSSPNTTTTNAMCLKQCWCGAESVDYARHGYSSCEFPCSGDDTEICGGYDAFSLYLNDGSGTVDPTPAPTPSKPAYVGCYKDKKDDRVFTGEKYTDEHMTNDVSGY